MAEPASAKVAANALLQLLDVELDANVRLVQERNASASATAKLAEPASATVAANARLKSSPKPIGTKLNYLFLILQIQKVAFRV